MKNKISYSAIRTYNECGLKYKLGAIDRIRPSTINSALIWGYAIDQGFNPLLKGVTLNEAKDAFDKNWSKYKLNGKWIDVESSHLINYTKKDLDLDLLKWAGKIDTPNQSWTSLKLKGHLFLDCYYKNILPHFKNVTSVQEKISIENKDGDELVGTIDFEAEIDGKNYLMDNKSSSVKYETDAPKNSDQLVIYYYARKIKVKLDGVGFAVLNKVINMNKIETCLKCNAINPGRHKTCNEFVQKTRCHGLFDTTFNPTVGWKIIKNSVSEEDENRTLETFDAANEGIKNGIFEANPNSCETVFGRCQYWKLCHEGSMENLAKLEKK